jgi:hypothetical protein
MVSWTEDQLAAYMAKMNQLARVASQENDVPDEGLEGGLLNRCIQFCRERGWPVWHDRSRKVNEAGWPDLFIFKPEGQMILIELKSANGRLRKEQQRLRLQLNWLGYTVHVVKSFKKFIDVVKSQPGNTERKEA